MIPSMVAWHRRLDAVRRLRGLAGRVGEHFANRQKYRRLSTFLQMPGHVENAYWTVRGFFSPVEAKQLVVRFLGGELNGNPLDAPEVDVPAQPTLADEISYLEMTRYMRNQLLQDSDLMSMAWGLELRTPFVDRKLIDTVGQVPAAQRLAAGKQLLLDAVPEIPTDVARRPKRGFQFPFEQWVRGQWRDIFEEVDLLTSPKRMTWYRHWSLFMLLHFFRMNGLECPLPGRSVSLHQSNDLVRC
jgi:asparagine synthase (glutamine-hydrolysing)